MDSAVLIRSGCPAVRQLKTKNEKFGTLTRVTVGERNVAKNNKTILLVGETGAGKSTMTNALVNYMMGVEFADEVWFQVVKEEEGQTSDVIVYEIFGFDYKTLPYSLTIIDTPGYGDTKGTEHDIFIIQRLFDLFRSEDGIHEIHAVGLVMKATDNQLSDQLLCILDLVMSLFGKNLQNNIVALITHSEGTTPEIALQALEAVNIGCVKNENNQPFHYMFNNCQKEQRTEETRLALEDAWRVTQKGMSTFTAFLHKSSPQQLQAMTGFNSSIRLSAYIHNLQDRIKLIELQQTEIKQIQEALKKHKEEIKTKTFTVELDEVFKDKEPINGEFMFLKTAVCCSVCKENCHYPGCTMAQDPARCEVMKYGRCTVCRNKCPASVHVKEQWKYVMKTRKVQRTKEENKKMYEKKMSDTKKKVKLSEMLEKEMENLNTKKSQLVKESYQHVVKLGPTILHVNSLSTYVPLSFLIEKMKEKGDTKRIQKLEEIDGQMDDTAKAVLQCRVNDTSPRQHIPDSVLISSGSPAVYQLKTKKATSGTLTRVTFGKKKKNKSNKTILLVGETGAGKSTLINALVNYIMGVKFEDKIWFQIVEDEKRSQTESQTSDVIMYEIFGFEGKTVPYSLTIIDTPGYGDTRGIEHDVVVIERLFDLFRSKDGVHKVHAVGLVMKSSVNRVSDRLLYIFDSVMSLFGKDIEKNIITLVTYSNGRTPKNLLQALDTANIKCARNEKKQPIYFLFNNCQHEDRANDAKHLETADKIATKGLSAFTAFLEKTAPQKLDSTLDVLNERIRLTACIQNLQERVKLTELKQTEMHQIQEALKKHEEMKTENFTVEIDEVRKDKESIDDSMWLMTLIKGAVCCTVCEENCHYPGCSSAKSPEDCEVMKEGRCTVCTMKCPASVHVKGKWRYIAKTRKVQKSLEDIKKRSKREKRLSFLGNLENEIECLAREKSDLLDESFQHVVKLEGIALKANSVSTFVYLDFLIEKMKEKEDTKKVQKLEEMKSKVDDGTRSKLQYVWSKLTAAGKKVKEALK
ncbi:uncharacterized protein LOC108249697 [Kryptolebias marmoratus]|uniref:Uncharacterized LOC108249697 n=1 Tax=Kryptolebias marmoratus TaxID=37003 RepID=A0A3Q3EQ56_KRYMA|nr:uncharacterized protein LOC108249697 [Kryptolebias marmoratus]